MKWWKRQTPKPEVKYVVVEHEKPLAPVESLTHTESVESLRHQPGFQWLLQKLQFQGERLRTELANSRFTSLEEVYFLQSGLHWCNWLQDQLDFNHAKYLAMRPATTPEALTLEQIESSIQRIGESQSLP